MIRAATTADLDALAALRFALWPDEPLAQRRAEAEENLALRDGSLETLVVEDHGAVAGFAEISLRRDYVNGCETSPVGFIEGIYVRPESRRRGLARALVVAAEGWARAAGCSELASDALLDNLASHGFHRAAGFAEAERVVYFRKPL